MYINFYFCISFCALAGILKIRSSLSWMRSAYIWIHFLIFLFLFFRRRDARKGPRAAFGAGAGAEAKNKHRPGAECNGQYCYANRELFKINTSGYESSCGFLTCVYIKWWCGRCAGWGLFEQGIRLHGLPLFELYLSIFFLFFCRICKITNGSFASGFGSFCCAAIGFGGVSDLRRVASTIRSICLGLFHAHS